MINLKPNQQRAKNAIILIWIVLALEIISLISGYFQYELLQSVSNGNEISIETANENDTREQIISFINLIAYIVSAITFIQWFRRAYYNLHIKIKNLSHNESWAAGSWFVPVITWYRPFQIMKEMYIETKKILIKYELISSSNITTNLLGVWWTLWVINNIVGQFVFRYSLKAENIEELITMTVASIIMNIIGIPLALITIQVIKDYANIEHLLFNIKDEASNTNI
jgi:hypothetical protein